MTMNFIKMVKDYIEMRTVSGKKNWVVTVKNLWEKSPLWVKSLVVATNLTFLLAGFVLITNAIIGAGMFVLTGILALWWTTHRLMRKGMSKTLWQIWTILVVVDSTVTIETIVDVPVVEIDGDGEQRARITPKAEVAK